MLFSGHLRLRAEPRPGGATVLAEQSFRAPFHLSKPYQDLDTDTLLVQVVNPTAGILSGDDLEAEVVVARGAAVLLTTPSASRVFRMRSGAAESRQRYAVEAGGWLEVWPEPLVPHAGSTFRQTTRLDVEPGAGAFYTEMLLPGRLARGEWASWERLTTTVEVCRGGRLILRERFDQSGAELAALNRLSHGDAPMAFASALLLPPEETPAGETPPWLAQLHALQAPDRWIGISPLVYGGWSFKFLATDGDGLRRTLRAIRSALAPHYPHLACDPRKL